MSDTSSSSGTTYPGFIGETSPNAEFNRNEFHIDQKLTRVRTVMAVKIMAIHGGGLGPPPTVDVMPLVNTLDGVGNATPHGTIYGIPVARNQGGGNAIINDPIVGDVGIMSLHDRDISSLIANNGAASNPGSGRTHSPSDGTYHGAMLNQATPDQYIQWTETGLVIADKNGNKITFGPSGISCTVVGDGLTCNGEITAGSGTSDSVTVQKHTHPGTQPPTPGT